MAPTSSDVSIQPRATKESSKDRRSCEGGRLGRAHEDGGDMKGKWGKWRGLYLGKIVDQDNTEEEGVETKKH